MTLTPTLLAVPFLAAVVVSLMPLGPLAARREVPGRIWLMLSLTASAVWNLCVLLAISSPVLADRLVWSKLEYLGANTAAPLMLLFFLNYPLPVWRLSRLQTALVFVLPVITIAAVMTNEWHAQFWTAVTPAPGPGNLYLFGHGPFYWLSLLYNYACAAGLVALMVRNLFHFRGLYRRQVVILLVSSLFPIGAGLAYSFGLGPLPGLDIVPIAFSLSALGIWINVIFVRMLDVVPLGRNLLVENLQDGVIVLNQARVVVDINPAARRLLFPGPLNIGDTLDALDPALRACLDHPGDRVTLPVARPPVEWLEIQTKALVDGRGRPLGGLSLIRDITEQKRAEQIIRTSVEQASITGERRRIRRELHDLVTQNVYTLQLFARGGQAYAEQGEWPQVQTSLTEIAALSFQALKDLRLLLYQLKEDPLGETSLVEALRLRLDAVERQARIETRLETDLDVAASAAVQRHLYAVAVEALNNSLKHAHAARLTVRLRQYDDRLQLEIEDDGCGSSPAQAQAAPGFGLRNMAERMEHLGGEFQWLSTPGVGTRVTVTVPRLAKEARDDSSHPHSAGG